MYYFISLDKFKNIRFILTSKYIIFLTKNGVIKFNTNIYNLFITNNKLYCNLQSYRTIKSNLSLFYLNIYYNYIHHILSKQALLMYSYNYLQTLYTALYYATYTYNITLILKGIGYKFVIVNNILKIRVGYSHFIDYLIPSDIYLFLKNPTTLILYSNNKHNLMLFASLIKLQKKTNLYKGTGIFYFNEYLTLKKKNNSKNAK